jgi:hypothetical protein
MDKNLPSFLLFFPIAGPKNFTTFSALALHHTEPILFLEGRFKKTEYIFYVEQPRNYSYPINYQVFGY